MIDRFLFYSVIKGNKVVAFLRTKKLLIDKCKCVKCGGWMNLVRRVKSADGETWQCALASCQSNRTSVRITSVFDGMRASLWKYAVAIYEWCRGSSVESICEDAKLGRVTVMHFTSFLRRTTQNWREAIHDEKIGGVGKVVEIDETLIAHRKFNRGRVVAQQWLFGGVERETGKFFVELVPNRSRETLERVLLRRVERGMTVYSDEWSSYRHISHLGLDHHTVNHSRNFVNPQNGVHTQTVESLWNRLKRFFRRRGLTNRSKLDEYLAEFYYRENNEDVFEAILTDIGLQNLVILNHKP